MTAAPQGAARAMKALGERLLTSDPPAPARKNGETAWLPPLVRRVLRRGTTAAFVSGLVLVVLGRREARSGAAPLNAISHWLWPRSALRADGLSTRHTVPGVVIHWGASCFWSALYEGPRRCQGTRPGAAVCDAMALSTVAAWVDLVGVPERLSPGFEHRLSPPSLCLVYLAFAAGLVLGEFLPARTPIARRTRQPRVEG